KSFASECLQQGAKKSGFARPLRACSRRPSRRILFTARANGTSWNSLSLLIPWRLHGRGVLVVILFVGRRRGLVLRLTSHVLHLLQGCVLVLLELFLIHGQRNVGFQLGAFRRDREPLLGKSTGDDGGHCRRNTGYS